MRWILAVWLMLLSQVPESLAQNARGDHTGTWLLPAAEPVLTTGQYVTATRTFPRGRHGGSKAGGGLRVMAERTAKVVLIRGVFGIFSTGLDELGQQLHAQGYDVEITSPVGCSLAALKIREGAEGSRYRTPIILIGHSMGGRACVHIARYLETHRMPVELILIVDANPWLAVPSNVRRCVNLYVTNPWGVFHGSPVEGDGCREVVNIDITTTAGMPWSSEIGHFNIDKAAWIHRIVIGEVARACERSRVEEAVRCSQGGN
jgi:hypothetical protein